MDQANIDDIFSSMLGELDGITQELDEISPPSPETKRPVAKYSPSQHAKVESQITDFDEEDVNLTAMLNDLCSFEANISSHHDDLMGLGTGNGLETNYNSPIPSQTANHLPPPPSVQPAPTIQRGAAESLEALSVEIDQDQNQPPNKELTEAELALLSPEEREERIRSEKVRIALEKMKEARVQKLVVKIYNKDNSSKTMVIDERMSTREVMLQLIEKNHFDHSPNWALIEEMPSLFLERMCEEHEKPCDTMKYWTRDTTNQLRFLERKDKYALFKNPQHYLLTSSDQMDKMQERQKQTLIEEFFSGKGPSSGVPEVQGFLHIKNGKSWSRKYCVLRSSGLYVSKSGEPKKGKKLTDLVCLVMFEQTYLYLGRGWKKKFKAPFEYGFALKHPAFQTKSKHVRYLACEDFKSLMRWTVGIRLAKYGRDLLNNYEKTNEEMKSKSSVPALKIGYRHEQAPDTISVKSTDSVESRGSSVPRPVGVKNMFEGAWQRANQTEKANQEQGSSPSISAGRAQSTWKPNPKKTSNWWDLQQDQASAEPKHAELAVLVSVLDGRNVTAVTPADRKVRVQSAGSPFAASGMSTTQPGLQAKRMPSHCDRSSRSRDPHDTVFQVSMVDSSPSHLNAKNVQHQGTPTSGGQFQTPPINSFPPPPPSEPESVLPLATDFASPAPVSPKPPNSTFTSFDDPLPPPPPMMMSSDLVNPAPFLGSTPPPPSNRGNYKPPPPVVPPKASRSPRQGHDDSIGRTAF